MQATADKSDRTTVEKKSGFRWVVLAMIFLVYMIAGADRANIGVVVPFIKESFHLTNTDIGAMTGLFYLGYAAIQIPSGIFFSKYGVRKLYSLSIVLTSVATFIMGASTNVFQMKAARLLLGVSEGPLNIGIITTINRWFPPQEKGTATGVFMSSIKFAPAIVPPICAWIILMFGWREVFYIFAVPGFISAVLWWWLVKDNPKDSPYCSQAEVDYINSGATVQKAAGQEAGQQIKSLGWLDKIIRTKRIKLLDTNKSILLSWNVWGCALGYFFMVGITYAIMTWVPTYLVTVKKFSIIKMGFVAAAPWVGAMLGNLIGGLLSDRVFDKRRKPVMILTAASTVCMMYSLLYAPNDPLILGGVLLVAGILLNLGYSTFLVYPMGLATKQACPFAASIINTAGSLGGAFAPFIVGVILDSFNWDMVFTFLSASSLITLFVLFTIIEPIEDKK